MKKEQQAQQTQRKANGEPNKKPDPLDNFRETVMSTSTWIVSGETNKCKRSCPGPQEAIKKLGGKGVGKAPTIAVDCARSGEHASLGTLKVTYATKQSYICFKSPDDGKPKLLIGVTDTQSPNHAGIVAALLKYGCSKKATKQQLIDHRSKLLEKA